MKKGKDDEKIMGPLFPRLHVNDTEKGGPRAPPRNKMALYEQLSLPSQRFNNYGSLPLNPNKASSLVPSASSSQGSAYERNLHHVRPSMPSHPADNLHFPQHDGENSNATSAQIQQRKVGDIDDFRVPIFDHSRMNPSLGKTQNGMDGEDSSTFDQNSSVVSKLQNAGSKDQKNNSSGGSILTLDARNHSEENPETCFSSKKRLVKSSLNIPIKGNILISDDESPNQQNSDHPVAGSSSPCENNVCLQQEASGLLQRNDNTHGEGFANMMRQIEKGSVWHPISDSDSREDPIVTSEPEIDNKHHRDETCRLVQHGNSDKSDDVSEMSMVDSLSMMDISPDDVVGIIGQKRFWKARRLISNQQRLLALQVFELHRLTKVQRLIAASPNLLFKETNYLEKHSTKVSPGKKLPSEYVATSPIHDAPKRNNQIHEQQNRKMEFSAGGAVGKTSLSSVNNGSQPSNCQSFTGSPAPFSACGDTKIAPWCFHHSFGHQLFVPVVTPSEGLVYKPYTAPGFTGSVCGGCQPLGMTPLTSHFMNPTYGIPTSHHHYRVSMPTLGVSPIGHGYFPPYGMPTMNLAASDLMVEQMENCSGSGSQCQTGQLFEGMAKFDIQNQSSNHVPTDKNGLTRQATMFLASKGSEVQGSTASSPANQVQEVGTTRAVETRDSPLPLPMASADPEAVRQPQETRLPRRAIKVVPHNSRSATESAARIFQSIQEERKQYDSRF